jgi:hypothetical protein
MRSCAARNFFVANRFAYITLICEVTANGPPPRRMDGTPVARECRRAIAARAASHVPQQQFEAERR